MEHENVDTETTDQEEEQKPRPSLKKAKKSLVLKKESNEGNPPNSIQVVVE